MSTAESQANQKRLEVVKSLTEASTAASEFYREHEDLIEEIPKDPYIDRFNEFMETEWGLPAVQVFFRGLFSGNYPPIPIPTQWNIPPQIDIVELTWQQVQTPKFIEEIWPSLRMLMNDNIANTQWTAQVATVLAFYRIIQILPIAMNGYKEQDAQYEQEG